VPSDRFIGQSLPTGGSQASATISTTCSTLKIGGTPDRGASSKKNGHQAGQEALVVAGYDGRFQVGAPRQPARLPDLCGGAMEGQGAGDLVIITTVGGGQDNLQAKHHALRTGLAAG